MPRPNRQSAGGIVYHALNRANGRTAIFSTPSDYEAFERVLAEGLSRLSMRMCGYCIMPNHWHLLLWPRADGDLSEFMGWITLTHTQRWHAFHGTAGIGHLYQGRFKSFPVQSSEHYLTVLRYVESNPFRAALVSDSANWPFSSLALRNGACKAGLQLDPGPVQLPENWNRLVNVLPGQSITAQLQNCITRGCPYGTQAWTALAAERLGLQTTLRPRGRPKKRFQEPF